MLFGLWFVIFWILGGVFFAIVSATRFVHLRKARFSCLFTVASIAASYGAALGGRLLARPIHNSPECSRFVAEKAHNLGEVLTCNYEAVFLAGGLCFALLLMGGLIAMLVSRVEKKS